MSTKSCFNEKSVQDRGIIRLAVKIILINFNRIQEFNLLWVYLEMDINM